MRPTIMLSAALSGLILLGVLTSTLFSHCQIPCGIYNDDARFSMMLEDVSTLKKCVHEIGHLSEATPPNYNQLVRWIDNKEIHADQISDTVCKYFLAQRIKEGQKNYEAQLVAAHKIIVLSMKVKQTVDPKEVEALEKAVLTFKELYAKR